MSENDGSSKSSSGMPSGDSGSSRLDSASAGSGTGSSGHSNSGTGPESAISLHSHGSSLKGAATSATSDSAYGSITQSQKSGSGSGSRSSKSQVSSNSSNATASAEQQPKPRKEKDSKKRKSNKASSIPPAQSPGQAQERPASACSSKGASSAAALISAASTATANACSSSTVEVAIAVPGTPESAGMASGTAMSTGGSAEKGESMSFSTRAKLPRTGVGIRGIAESRAVQAAALSRALDCLKGIGLSPKESHRSDRGDASSSLRSIINDSLETSVRKRFSYLEEVPTVKSKEAFIVTISLQDGIVIYVTSSLTDKLGYPAEMWCGRSLLDFIHPKDRLSFTNQITSKLLSSLDKEDASSGISFSSDEGQFPRGGSTGTSGAQHNMVCCRLRMYRGLRTSGFSIVDKKTSYLPFKINLSLEKITVPKERTDTPNPKDTSPTKEGAASDAQNTSTENDLDSSEYYLLAYAVPISTAYKTPEDKTSTGQFGLRHSASCLFSEVDLGAVPYLGHLPQDLLGMSALDYYHPNDLPELKNIYDSIIGLQGKSVRSKPYSFRAFNGCYVLLETDWTCFINPWTKKLEFVAGHHRVLKGPSNPDVFASPPDNSVSVMDTLDPAAVENVKKLQAEICTILTGSPKPAQQQRTATRTESALKETSTQRRKNLATLMGSLIDEVAKARGPNSCGNSCSSRGGYAHCKPQYHSPTEEGSLLGDTSVAMGDISTHGGSGVDSSSGDTPLSYSLLNYNQNLERYFQSQPKMIPSDGSGESSGTGSTAGSKPGQIRTPNMSSEEEGGCLGNSGSGTLPSSDSQKLSSSISHSTDSQNGGLSDQDYKGQPLTKEVLGRHDEIMEKEFMQLHKELRNRTSGSHRHGQLHSRKEAQGVKRGQASSWEEGGARSRHKHTHVEDFCATPQCYQSPSTGTAAVPSYSNDWASLTGRSTMIPSNLLPPFSVSATATNQPSPVFSIPVAKRGDVTSALPAFYLATAPSGSAGSAARPMAVQMGATPYVQMSPHHHPQTLGPTYSLQPYSTYPHGVIYQPVMVPPVLFQPGIGMMVPTAAAMHMQQQSGQQNHQQSHQASSNGAPEPQHRASRDRRPQPYQQEAHFPAQRQHSRPSTSYATEGTGDVSHNSSSEDYRQHPAPFREPQIIPRSQQQQSLAEHYGGNSSQNQQQAGNVHRSASKRTPPWMEAVSVSSELVYKYQLPGRNTTAVLEADREKLRTLQQPMLLNHQLFQLYTEMEQEHRSPKGLALDECETSTSSSSAEDTNLRRKELRRRSAEFRRTMLYEENAPFPQPAGSSTQSTDA